MATAGGDLGLKRLFRPTLDSLSVDDQLPYYTTRDLQQSRNSRLDSSGPRRLRLRSPTRRRVIDTSLCSPPAPRDEGSALRGSDACRLTFKRSDLFPKRCEARHSPAPPPQNNIFSDDGFPPALTRANYGMYREWVEQRRAMRESLDSMGLSKAWLLGKQRGPLEAKALQALLDAERRKKNDGDMLKQLLAMEDVKPRVRTPPPRKPSPPPPPQMPTILPKLELFLQSVRWRLLDFFKHMDRDKDWLVSVQDLEAVVKLYRLAITSNECRELFAVVKTKKKGKMRYEELLKGLAQWSNKLILSSAHLHYAKALENETLSKSVEEREEVFGKGKSDDVPDEQPSSPPPSDGDASTLGGWSREADVEYKIRLRKQFDAVCRLCEQQGLVLEKSLLERALLLPEDGSREECLGRLSGRYACPPVPRVQVRTRQGPESRGHTRSPTKEILGGAYLETKGPSKVKQVVLSTGRAGVAAKTDCWMSFKDYMQFANLHPSRYPYKHRKPSSSSSFWPGALLDRLRLCLDSAPKAHSLHSVFQPVRRQADSLEGSRPGVCGWPQNEAGYVQFGTIPEKQCTL